MLKQLGIPLVWILLSGALIVPAASLPAFAVNATTITMMSSQDPSTLVQPLTFTASVVPTTATGVIIFNDTSTNPPTILGASVVSGGFATFSISSLSVGTHNIVAIYSGDASNLSSNSGVFVQIINKIGTTTTLTPSVNPSEFGQSVNFTATIAPVSSSLTPNGTIQFLVNGIATGSPVTLIDGHASFVTSSLSVGTNSISATYSGNTIFDTSTGTITQTTHQTNITTSLSSSQNPSTIGTPITFTDSILPITTTGTVQFNDTSTNPPTILGTSALAGGVAIFSTSSLSVGSHTIVATYLGDINNPSSVSNTVTQIVNSISASSISLQSNMTSIISGHSITFTSTMSPTSANGTVQFKVNGTNLGVPVTLSSGLAVFSTTALPLGSDIVSASYSGNSIFNPSTSNSVKIIVSSTSQGVALEKIKGNGNLGKGNNFEFNIDFKNSTKIKGHLNYHDKNARFDLHSKQITSVFVDSSMTHIVITGQAKTKGNPHNTTQLTFSASISVSNANNKTEQFSIVVTDSSGNTVYQKSGTANGHIVFSKLKIKHDHPENKNEQKGSDNENDQNDNDGKNDQKNMTKISLTTNESVNHKNNGKNGHKNNGKDD